MADGLRPAAGVTNRASVDGSHREPNLRGAVFQRDVPILSLRDVVSSSHQALASPPGLSDSFAGRDPNATTSGSSAGSSCLCKDCTKLD
ncbi:hypothetical protein, partial [Synechococcus sp. CCY 9618]|uniref:hypothetical protein n=1 Tax=Synechococcus sp. CCY 9618 TaxID=2815602 RepID=UPI001C221CA1